MKPPVMNLSNQKNQHIVWLDVVRFIAMSAVIAPIRLIFIPARLRISEK